MFHLRDGLSIERELIFPPIFERSKEFEANTMLIFCNSFLSLPVTLQLVEENKAKEVIEIVSENINVINFLERYPALVKSTFLINQDCKNKLSRILSDIKFRRCVKDRFSNYTGHKVYFFDFWFAEHSAYLVMILSIKNSIFFAPASVLPKKNDKIYQVKSLIYIAYYRLLFGLKLDAIEMEGSPYYLFSNDFFKKIGAINIKLEVNYKILKKYVVKEYKFDQAILFLAGGVVEGEMIDTEIYVKYIGIILTKIGLENIVIKNHPDFNAEYGLEASVKRIPSFVPANLLIDQFDCVIGFNSATLFEAANSGKTSISLMYLIPTINVDKVERYKEYLNANLLCDKKILFPQKINELIGVLDQLKKT